MKIRRTGGGPPAWSARGWPSALLGLGVSLCVGCSAARDERLPSERLPSQCSSDAQCGSFALCQAGTCLSNDSASVIGKVEGAPDSVQISALDVGDQVCAIHAGQGLVCTLRSEGGVSLMAPTVPGYRFVGWTGDGCQSNDSKLEVSHVDNQRVCTAHYLKQLRVSGTVEGDATLLVVARSSSPGAACQDNACEVAPNQSVVLTAPLRDGTRLTGFDGPGCEAVNGYQVSVTPVRGDVSCVAKYTSSLTARGQPQGLAVDDSAAIVASSSASGALCSGSLCAVDPGADVMLFAAPVDGYRMAGWTGEERCLSNDPSLLLQGLTRSVVCNAVYVPRFAVALVSEGAAAPAGALLAQSESAFALCTGPSCSVDARQDVRLIAGTIPGFRLSSWSGSGCAAGSGASAAAADVSRDVTCVAHYVPGVSVTGTVVNASAEVDARSASGGAVCQHGSCAIAAGGTVTLSAPSLAGRTFLGWSGDPGCSTSAPSVTLGNVPSSINCVATFALRITVSGRAIPDGAGQLQADSSASNASCGGGQCVLDASSAVVLSATQGPAFRFSGWSGDPGCGGTSASLAFASVTKNIACNANFVPRIDVVKQNFLVRALALTGGSASASSGGSPCANAACTVSFGDSVQLAATAATGYAFAGWTGCSANGPAFDIPSVQASQTCTATFAPIRLSLSSMSVPVGVANISASSASANASCAGGSCQLDYGSSAQLAADLNPPGYRFESWSGCSGQVEGASVRFASITANTSCSASYVRRWTVTGRTSDPGLGRTSCATGCAVDQGGTVELVATPGQGNTLAGWSCAQGQTEQLTIANISASIDCLATFVPVPQ